MNNTLEVKPTVTLVVSEMVKRIGICCYAGGGEPGSYWYFSPRASILAFASFNAHVCMLLQRV